ncbi:MAG: MCE family protein [Chitinivibrionales bacterium]|nr:MCE family protein [Chitinivibrionales bacterium]
MKNQAFMAQAQRTVGYAVLIFLSVFIAGTMGYAVRTLFFPQDIRYIAFDQIGQLRIDDMVKVRGTTIGRVSNSAKHKNQVIITIECSQSLEMHANYAVRIIDKGIMGDRVLAISPGDSSGPLLDPGDTLEGMYQAGVADAIANTWRLKAKIDQYKRLSVFLRRGSSVEMTLAERFDAFVRDLDSVSLAIFDGFATVHRKLPTALDTFGTLLYDANFYARQTQRNLPELLANMESFVSDADSALTYLEDLAASMDKPLAELSSADHLLWQQHLEGLRVSLKDINGALKKLKKKGFILHPKLVF